MVHLLSALIVGSIYSGGYALRGKRLPLYPLSVVLLLVLVGMSSSAFIFEAELQSTMGWNIFSYARQVIVYSLWLQSLICAVLSIASFVNVRQWRYLAGGIFFVGIFLVLAYAANNSAMALTID